MNPRKDGTYGGYPTRSAYESALATRLRKALFELLGPMCGQCGCDLRTQAWEVNHLVRREWQPRKLSFYRRQKRYWQEAQEGLVEVACAECNASFRPPLPEVVREGEAPF